MIEPEEGVISALMVDPQAVEKVCGMLSPDMFENGMLGRAYLEYVRAYDKGKELTLAELQQALTTEYMPFEVEETLNRVLDSRLTSTMIEGSARAIVNRYKKSCVDRVLTTTLINESTVDDQIDGLIKDLESLRSGESVGGHTVAEIVNEHKEEYFCEGKKKLILFGDEGLDGLTGGFQGGDFILLGARPGCGKSALAMQWALTFSAQGLKVGYYNCEMQETALMERLVASKTGISVTRIRLAKAFQGEEEEKYRKAVNELLRQDHIMVFTGSKRVSEIKSDIRKHRFDVVIIDYLQLLTVDDRYKGNRAAEVSHLSLTIKNTAMSCDIPIIALSQLNRATEGRQTREPQLFDLRESGSLEQDASVCFFLWDKDEADRSQKGFKTSKSRSGVLGRHDLIFDGASMTFKAEKDATPFDGR